VGLGSDSQVLNESAAISLVIVDVLVDGLVTEREGSVNPQVVGDLLWTPVQFQQSDDVFPEAGGKMKAAPFAFPSGGCIAMGQICTILAVDELFVALKFPADSTRGTIESPGNIGFGDAPYPKLGDMIAFVLRELSVATQV
jgi:hypothetical protein